MNIAFLAASSALALVAASPVPAQDEKASTPENNLATARADTRKAVNPPATMTGEWDGRRTTLLDDGVNLTASYTSETAANIAGGKRKLVRESGQFAFGATVDAHKVLGIAGGTFQATITYRRGDDLGADASLGVLQQVQEVFGRGQTWRLSQFWCQQSFADGHADVKLGRLTQGEDFGAFSCDFMNLSFCGSPPGNLAGDYWYNWPISQWGIRGRVKNDSVYVMAGAYEVNPRNLDNTFILGFFHGARGVLLPAEVGYTPRIGASRLPGSYKLGGWYNTADGDDLYLDINRQPQRLTGLLPLRRDGRYGIYAQFQQQLTAPPPTAPRDRKPRTAWSCFSTLHRPIA